VAFVECEHVLRVAACYEDNQRRVGEADLEVGVDLMTAVALPVSMP
jgi:hypothetical protein